MTDDDFDRLQDEYDLCGVDGRLRDFAAAVEAAEREACEQAVRDEPELPGEIPQTMFEAVRYDKDACTEALRILVRVTKTEILARIAKRSNDSMSGLQRPARKDEDGTELASR